MNWVRRAAALIACLVLVFAAVLVLVELWPDSAVILGTAALFALPFALPLALLLLGIAGVRYAIRQR